MSHKGIEAANSLAQERASFSFDFITTGFKPKAFQTAEKLSSQLGRLPVKIDMRISEHATQSAGFLSADELNCGVCALISNPDRGAFGEKSVNQANLRFRSAVESISICTKRDIIVISRTTIISIYVGRIMRIDPFVMKAWFAGTNHFGAR